MTYLDVLLAAGLALGGIGVLVEAFRRRSRPPALEPGAPVPPELEHRVRLLLGEDRTVEAVKEVRKATGLGLVAAKQLVDGLGGDARHQNPS